MGSRALGLFFFMSFPPISTRIVSHETIFFTLSQQSRSVKKGGRTARFIKFKIKETFQWVFTSTIVEEPREKRYNQTIKNRFRKLELEGV